MVKVAWKTVNGYGPYAYLQKSVKVQGHVHSKHLAYLGKAGKGGLIPGKHFNVPSSGGFAGGRVRVPFVGEETEETLKPGPLAAVASMKAQVAAGLPAKQIVPDKPVKTQPVAPNTPKTKAEPAAAPAQPKVAPNKPATAAAAKTKAGSAPAQPKVAPNKSAAATAAKTKAGPALPQPEVAPNNPKAKAEPADPPEVAPNKPATAAAAKAKAKAGPAPAQPEVAPNNPKAKAERADPPEVAPDKPATAAAAKAKAKAGPAPAQPEVAPDNPKAKAEPADPPEVAPDKPATAAAAKAKAKAGPAPAQPEVAPDTEKAALAATLAAVMAKKAAAAPVPPKATPKISLLPKDNKGKALISAVNVKKLEAAASGGDLAGLEVLAAALSGKMLHKPKKAAILNAAAELKGQMQGTPVLEGDGGSGLGQTMSAVDTGKVKLPDQAVPDQKAVEKQRKAIKAGQKDYDADLEQISGKKGSNEGGLFKDKHLETFHYVKWPNSEARAKMEALTALLYTYAEVPVPSVRHINFKGKDAVVSDWIDGAAPMTLAEMKQHQDVRSGFAADAWLANWDVVGLQADNVVQGPGNKAYRIDLGGSVLFRAQGKGKDFPEKVAELETMRNPSKAPQASQVFDDLTAAELKASAQRVEAITDEQIDAAVDGAGLPQKSPEYPASQFGAEAGDLPKMLKSRLKKRRDHIVDTVIRAEDQKQAALEEIQESSNLKPKSVKAIATTTGGWQPTTPVPSAKWKLTESVMKTELGTAAGKEASGQVKAHYNSWKGASTTGKGSVLRWAAGAMHGTGRQELQRLRKYNDFLVKEGQISKHKAGEYAAHLEQAAASDDAAALVEGLQVTNRQNDALLSIRHPGKDTLTIYRGWKAPQVKYLGLQGAKVGDTIKLEDPPLYSWSFSPRWRTAFKGGTAPLSPRPRSPPTR